MLITFEREGIALGKLGTASIEANVPKPKEPLNITDPKKAKLFDDQVDVKNKETWTWGTGDSAKLALDGRTNVGLYVVSTQTLGALKDQVKAYGLDQLITTNGPLLLFEVGAKGDVNASGAFRYGVVNAGVSLKAGTEGGAAWVRPFAEMDPAKDVLEKFFKGIKLPAAMDAAPKTGELTVFQYDGNLKLGASVSAGFEAEGSASAEIGKLALSESFKGALTGKLSLGATVSGSFKVTVQAAEDENGKPMDGWARIVVTREKKDTFSAAADLKATAEFDNTGLPTDPKVFFGALLGVEAGNWINWADNLVQMSAGVTDANALAQKVDALGKDFLKTWLDKEVPDLLGAQGQDVLNRIKSVVDTYNGAEAQVLGLLDAYVDQGEQAVDAVLQKIQDATSLDVFKGQMDPELWDLLNRLTKGDPLDWMITRIDDETGGHIPTIQDLKNLADAAAGKARAMLKGEVGRFLTTAKEDFDLPKLMDTSIGELDKVSSAAKIADLASTRVGHFLARIVGQTLDSALNKAEQEELFNDLKTVRDRWDGAKEAIGGFLQDAASIDLEAELSAAYSRTKDDKALVDVSVNMADVEGLKRYKEAVAGNFEKVFDACLTDPVHCRLNKGTLSDKLTRKRTLKAAFFGWHSGFKYQDVSQVITSCTQKVLPGENGTLIVHTDIKGEYKDDVTKQDEARHAKFTLGLAAVTKPRTRKKFFNDETQRFLVETVEAKSASYSLCTKDDVTKPEELRQYLAFAKTAGLGEVEDLYRTLAHTIPFHDGNFGKVEVDYKVKFEPEALKAIFGSLPDRGEMHEVLRPIVLGRWVREPPLRKAGWAFYVDSYYKEYGKDQLDRFKNDMGLTFPKPTPPSNCPYTLPPCKMDLSESEVRQLSTLYGTEENVIQAWSGLATILASDEPKATAAVEEALSDFLKSSKKFGSFAGQRNFLFTFFDGMARHMAPGVQDVASSLVVTFKDKDEIERKVTFVQPGK